MAHRRGTRRTGPGCRHPRIGVPELSAARRRQRRALAHRPIGRLDAIDPARPRHGGPARVAAASGRQRGRRLPRGHRGNRRGRNTDPAASLRPAGRRVADSARSGPRRHRLSNPGGHRHAWRGRVGDPQGEPDANCGARHRTAARPATDRPSASGRRADTARSDANTAGNANSDGHAEREPVDSDQRVTVPQPEPDARPLADSQSEPVMRCRVRAVSEPVDALLVRVLRVWDTQEGTVPISSLS